MIRAAALSALLLAGPAAAQTLDEDVAAFVDGSILSIFYHELGHALIHIEEIPVFGQEEDAADVFAVIMTESIFDPDTSLSLAYDYALLFDADARARGDEAPAWWDVHGPDEQRFYNTVCLFYGADPDAREDYAEDMGLPEDRADTCPEEFDQAWSSWGGVIDTIMDRGAGDSLRLAETPNGRIGAVLTEEVAALNEVLTLSRALAIRVEPCDEANAFYDPAEEAVTFCSEYEDELIEIGREIVQP